MAKKLKAGSIRAALDAQADAIYELQAALGNLQTALAPVMPKRIKPEERQEYPDKVAPVTSEDDTPISSIVQHQTARVNAITEWVRQIEGDLGI